MARKRPPLTVEISSSDGSDDSDFERCAKYCPHPRKSSFHHSDSENSDPSDDSDSSDHENRSKVLFQAYMRKYEKLKKMEKKLSRSMQHESKKPRLHDNSKDAFTRFSVTTFSSMQDSLTPSQKKIIANFGFSSLLQFDKCYVPNKFAKWLAHLVDPRSGDIIFYGKVISLTKESLYYALGLPIGKRPFRSETSAGKAIILSKFHRDSVPPVTFFQDKLVSEKSLSDEDVFICFIMVAMNSFLCPNSLLVPSYKYFGIFEDLANAKDYDWCGFVLQWLLDSIRQFNKKNLKNGKECQTLGGCLYYLAVGYLDHVDFGSRQVSDSIPRICVWKGDMIKKFSEKDMSAPGSYGLRPHLHSTETCYAKLSCFMHTPMASLVDDSKFMEKLDVVTGCELPHTLKVDVCKLIESHTLNYSLSFNMNLASISSLPDDMKLTFTKLVEHAYKVDKSSQNLALNLLKVVSEAPVPVNDDDTIVDKSDCEKLNVPSGSTHVDKVESTAKYVPLVNQYDHHHLSQKSPSTSGCSNVPQKYNLHTSEESTEVELPAPLFKTPNKFVFPPSGYPSGFGPEAMTSRSKSRMVAPDVVATHFKIAPVRKPLSDISNVADCHSLQLGKAVPSVDPEVSNNDVIPLEDVNDHDHHGFISSPNHVHQQYSHQIVNAKCLYLFVCLLSCFLSICFI